MPGMRKRVGNESDSEVEGGCGGKGVPVLGGGTKGETRHGDQGGETSGPDGPYLVCRVSRRERCVGSGGEKRGGLFRKFRGPTF